MTSSAEATHTRWTLGPVDAPVTIVEYVNYQCPDVRNAEPLLAALRAEAGDRMRFELRHLPLAKHARAMPAAEAAEAAGAQGGFWEMHDRLLAPPLALEDADLLRYAEELGLDTERFAADLESHRHAGVVAADLVNAGEVNATTTPTLIVNGVSFRDSEVEQALARAREMLAE
ncbi:MAG: thioredoxin domain-containing protein [Thermomicrobiales bacterium]